MLPSRTHFTTPIAATLFLLLAIAATAHSAAPDLPFDGQWRTTFGIVTLKQTGDQVTGTYGNTNQFTLKGSVNGKKLTFIYQENQANGEAHWNLDDSPLSFHGDYQVHGGQAGNWDGWRPDPDAAKGKNANLAGLWLTDLGLMQLEQTGNKVKGHYALRGVSDIEGTITGRHFEFTNKAFMPGNGWFDVSANLDTFGGAATTSSNQWYGWKGRRAPEFTPHVKLIAGKIVEGSTKDLLTYSIRAPEGFREGNKKTWPAIVILHGSNMNGQAYVNTIAAAWPDIAKDYIIIGINGETPSVLGDAKNEPQFNFTYVSYVGRSTFKGFPGTDRESPALVADALDEFRTTYPVSRYFVGGHSQGGFLTYSLLMNFPEKIAGAFPVSGGVIFQVEPSAYDDEKVRAAQRAVPLAIVHSKQDRIVNFSSAEYAATLFEQSNWQAFHFFVENSGAGHRFAMLPVRDAIRWLEAQSSDDPKILLNVANECMKTSNYRDAISALNRTNTFKPDPVTKTRIDRLLKDIDAKATPGAKQFLPKIKENKNGEWISAFLEYKDNFEFAPAAQETMQAFEALRAQQEPAAVKTMNEARTEFQMNRADGGYAKYQEIVDKYYAATSYRNAKRWLAERN